MVDNFSSNIVLVFRNYQYISFIDFIFSQRHLSYVYLKHRTLDRNERRIQASLFSTLLCSPLHYVFSLRSTQPEASKIGFKRDNKPDILVRSFFSLILVK